MKKTILGLFLGLSVMGMAADGEMMSLTPSSVGVGTNVEGKLNINANVIAPLSIIESQSMEFGDIILGAEANSTTNGTMLVTGAPGNSITISIPASTIISENGIKDYKVKVKLTSKNDKVAQTLDAKGNLTQTISGLIEANQTKYIGKHTGTVTVFVKYN